MDVIMIAPKGPGHTVRSEYLKVGIGDKVSATTTILAVLP